MNKKIVCKFLIVTFLLTISSCSLVDSTRRSLLGGENKKRRKIGPTRTKMVTQDQYDELLNKYKKLKITHERLKDQRLDSGHAANLSDEMAKSKPSKNANIETVDVFGENGVSNSGSPTPVVLPSGGKKLSQDQVQKELVDYQKAVAIRENNKLDEAIKRFQVLEKSENPQIVVRSKVHIGEILMTQKEYDLALQVYDDLINNNAFSGMVIHALRNAILCADKLGSLKKKNKYLTLLKDVFKISG